jgi:eukaryotic-like serine/threonine-protein kinase
MTTRPETRSDEAGRLGSYRILRLIGRGGMGDVYLAWTGLRLVAIKILHANYASDPTFVAMFLAEARVAGRINHSSIAQVLDVGVDGGRLYMVMEYVAGNTLDDLINDHALGALSTTAPAGTPELFPLRIAAAVFASVAHALAAAHKAQIVHRDISPHNLLVSDTGAIKLIDFGIARTQNSDQMTSPGTFRGRFGYMAPEYVQGRPCDHRVDLFALGVVMWETFTRRRLYPGAAAAQLYAVIERPAERLDAVIPDFPVVLADVVERLLEREPDDRYDHANEVAQTLERLMPALSDGGFRNLAHWTDSHLADRIEERARADHQDLQVIVDEEAAQLAADEPEIEMRSYTHSGSQVAAWTATSTTAAKLPPRLAFGLGMGAAALIACAVALWVLVMRDVPAPASVARVTPLPQLVEPIPQQQPVTPATIDASVAAVEPAPPDASAEPELEIKDSDSEEALRRGQKGRKDGRDGRDGRDGKLAQAEPMRTVEQPRPTEIAPMEPTVAPPEPVPAISVPVLPTPPPPQAAPTPKTPRVPAALVGDAGRGGNVVGQCNGCHTESKKKRIDGKQMTRSQWERFFRNGTHDRYRPLGDRMSVTDLAAAKAYLMGRALDGSADQGAGVR